MGLDELLDVTSSTARHEGTVAADRGNHRGDVDGVRAWRDGDAVGSIHWPSSLRAGDLIVHDRAAVADERWVVDLDGLVAGPVDDSTAARLRGTLDEGLRRGHDVAVSVGGEPSPVRSDDDAATWSARAADARSRDSAATRPAWWRRPIRLSRPEPESTVETAARWAAGAAALASLAMLVGALSRSPALIATITVGLVLGVVVSTWLGRRSGRRPAALQAAIVLTIVVAVALIAADARGLDGLLAVLRGPMPDMLMLLVVLHGFEVVDRRTLRVHQAITFAVASYAAGLRIDDALGWWIGAWGVAFFASLLLTGRTAGDRCRRRPLADAIDRVDGRCGDRHARAAGPDPDSRRSRPTRPPGALARRRAVRPAGSVGVTRRFTRADPEATSATTGERSAGWSDTRDSPNRSTPACEATSATRW